ncbi:hypothetical protein B0O99DRAFT_614006 [Bisporella sp. PMI_857]|nr:hypothetical protein B0O99DRAFT_614006 [Bisporella sp. PMI_857]
MSSAAPIPLSQSSKAQRVLACVRCQQRKIKCDKKIPCANCSSCRTQCMPATLTPRGPRKRRFPERELLERLRKYEDLLHQNNIKFEPLHKDPARAEQHPAARGGDEGEDEKPEAAVPGWSSPASTVKFEKEYKAKNYWNALNSKFRDSDDESDSSHDALRNAIAKQELTQFYGDNDHFLFGSHKMNVDLSTLHPGPVPIFKLWQIYVDNVNPLLKVIHATSLQGRIIEAAGDPTNIGPTLEALMFSIYCMAIYSLDPEVCQVNFDSLKEDLLSRYHFGCQQALLNCGFLRSDDRDCLTALYLYLVSLRSSIAPRSLSPMLGLAIRIAQRIGIHSESTLAKYTPLEAELSRRLWWSLVLFDSRISEMADHKSVTLDPTWDCRIPLNIDDSDLRPEMKEPPAAQTKPTDALFIIVRSEIGDFLRHSTFHLDFTNPMLKPLAKDDELVDLEKMIENKYLKSCDLENPLQFMSIWTARVFLAKCYLVGHHSKFFSSSANQTDTQRDTAISYAIKMLECDTKLASSPLTKRFLWQLHLYFPFPAYIQIVQDLRGRPMSNQAEQAWAAMSDNYEAHFGAANNPFLRLFAKIVLLAWEARELACRQLKGSFTPPKFVSTIRNKLTQIDCTAQVAEADKPNKIIGDGGSPIRMALGADSNEWLYGMGGQAGYGAIGSGIYPEVPGQAPPNIDMNQLGWPMMDWDSADLISGPWNTRF